MAEKVAILTQNIAATTIIILSKNTDSLLGVAKQAAKISACVSDINQQKLLSIFLPMQPTSPKPSHKTNTTTITKQKKILLAIVENICPITISYTFTAIQSTSFHLVKCCGHCNRQCNYRNKKSSDFCSLVQNQNRSH